MLHRTPVKNTLFDAMQDPPTMSAQTTASTADPTSSPSGSGSTQTRPQQQNHHELDDARQISRISVRPPPFWRENPALWFKQLESQFFTNGITVSETKFHIAVSALDTAIISQVSDIVMNPPLHEKYEQLKRSLQERFADSEEQRFRKLLGNLALGDKKPSHLWREMRELAGANYNEQMLRSLWMQRLPTQSQAILSAEVGAIERLLTLADRIHNIFGASEVNALTNQAPQPSSFSQNSSLRQGEFVELRDQIDQLTKQVASLTANKHHHRNRNRSRSATRSSRSKTPQTSTHKYCWYHHRFGNDATKCVSPCEFVVSEN